jgi:DNA-binding NarL/FixJ family response regulator
VAVSVLIVDDQRAFRERARALLAMRGYGIAGEAGAGCEAVDEAQRVHADAVLLDVNLPDIDGLEVARRLAALATPPRVLLTSADADVDDDALRECGAVAFVHKDELVGADLPALLGDPGAPAG